MVTVRPCAIVASLGRVPLAQILSALILTVFAIPCIAEELPFPPPRPSLNALEEIQGLLATPIRSPIALSRQSNDPGELITERYPNRAVRLQRYVIQDADRNYVNHGSWAMFDLKGQVTAQGQYRNGKRHGEWMRIMPEFPIVNQGFKAPFISRAEFDSDKLHGIWKISDSQERVVASWQFLHGTLDGTAATWYPNGQQRREMTFKNGIPDGEAKGWKSDGKVWAREFYRDGKQLVPVVTWHDRQQKESEGWMVRSNFTIRADFDWWEGTVEIMRDETQGEDVKTGVWTEWHPNGSVKFVGEFESGMPVAQHTWWHANGQKMLAGIYESGMQEGRWTEWHASGVKQIEGTYIAGAKTGTWTTWSQDGMVADVQHIQNDAPSPFPNDEPIIVNARGDMDVPYNVSHILAP